MLQPHFYQQPFVYLEEGWAGAGHGTRSTSSPWTMLHASCWHGQWSSSEHSSQLCQKTLRLKPWELSEQSTRIPRWVFCSEVSKSQAPLKSYLSSCCCLASLRQIVDGRLGLPHPEPCSLPGFVTPEDFHQKEQRAKSLPSSEGGVHRWSWPQQSLGWQSLGFFRKNTAQSSSSAVVGFSCQGYAVSIVKYFLLPSLAASQLAQTHSYSTQLISPCVCHIRPQGNPWAHMQLSF